MTAKPALLGFFAWSLLAIPYSRVAGQEAASTTETQWNEEVACILENNNAPVIGWFQVANTGTVTFSTLQTQAAGAGSDIVSNASGFTNAGTKGLVVGTVMLFALI